MNIGIITHYDVHNHGAVLQLTALKRVLECLGHRAHALRFDKNYDFLGHDKKAKYSIGLGSLGIYIGYLRENGLSKTVYNFRKRKTLRAFLTKYGIIGDYYSEAGDIDLTVVGSDEVFALHTGPTPIFFGYAAPSRRVISYAGSFGPTMIGDIDRLHCRDFVAGGLKGMEALSVRDENSRAVVEQLLGFSPQRVCDPVLLYGYTRELNGGSNPMPGAKPYLLVYAYDARMNDPEETEAIRAYARSKGLHIVSPGFFHPWADRNVNCDPEQLLLWFKHASGVVTDTFHGTVMSIIARTPMAVKTRDNANKILALLDEHGLADRRVAGFDDLDAVFGREIDWKHVDDAVLEHRKESMDWLKSALDGATK